MTLYKPEPESFLPLSLQKYRNSQQSQEEEVYLQLIKQKLIKCQVQLEYHNKMYSVKYYQMQQELFKREKYHEEIKNQLLQKISSLENQNFSLKKSLQQFSRTFKRNNMQKQIQSQKFDRLNKIITEKQAVIKYLQQKNSNMKHNDQPVKNISRHSSKSYLHIDTLDNNSINLDQPDFNCSFIQEKIFTKRKNPPTLKFGDYKTNGVKIYVKEEEDYFNKSLMMKNRRHKTQSFENNQNKNYNSLQNAEQKLKNLINYKEKGQPMQETGLIVNLARESQRNSLKTSELSRNYDSNKSLSGIKINQTFKIHNKAALTQKNHLNHNSANHSDLLYDKMGK